MRRRQTLFFPALLFTQSCLGTWAKASFRAPDVIVIGAGAAGLAAACTAAENGAKVLVLEKNKEIGGNTWIGGGYFNFVSPEDQTDSPQNFYLDIIEEGGSSADPALAKVLAFESYEVMLWLKSLGMNFVKSSVASFGNSRPRSARPSGYEGDGYIRTLSLYARQLGVEIITAADVIKLITRKGSICGVQALIERKLTEISASKSVILASGGFASNEKMIRQYASEFADLPSISLKSADGKMIEAAQDIGAAVTLMDKVFCMVGTRRGGQFRGRLHGDNARYILVDHRGKRFIREDAGMTEIQDKILSLPEKEAFLITDDDNFRSYSPTIQRDSIRAVETGDIVCSLTLENLAKQLNISAHELKKTIDEYNGFVRQKFDPLGKAKGQLLHELRTAPYWAAFAVMNVCYTVGGLRINNRAQVLDKQGEPIHGLYAAGEITGGVHGQSRLSGNGLTDALVFGRKAGKTASSP